MLIHHLDTLFRGILHKVTLLLKGMLHIRGGMVLLLLVGKKVACLKDAWRRSAVAAFWMLASDQDSGVYCDQLFIDSSGLGHNIMYRLFIVSSFKFAWKQAIYYYYYYDMYNWMITRS